MIPMKKQKAKRKISKREREHRRLYQNKDKYPFIVEFVPFWNQREGRDTMAILFLDKVTKKVVKWKMK